MYNGWRNKQQILLAKKVELEIPDCYLKWPIIILTLTKKESYFVAIDGWKASNVTSKYS